MDRTAWIVVSLCVIALVAFEFFQVRNAPLRPAPAAVQTATALPSVAAATPTPFPTASPASAANSAPHAAASPASSDVAAATPAPAPDFAEKFEIVSNKDVELRFTNRGGAIREATLLNHVAEGDQRVRLNSDGPMPIGAILDDPGAPDLAEFTGSKTANGAIDYTRTTPERLTVHKNFRLIETANAKDNFVAELAVDFRNDGAQPYSSAGYFVTTGSARPIHATDWSAFTAFAFSVDGKLKQVDVNWFAEQNIPVVGIKRRDAQKFYRETPKGGAEWAGVTSQFFAAIVTPLDTKGAEVWGSRFDLSQTGEKTPVYGIEGALRMPPLQLQPGQTATAKFQLYLGPKIYNRLAKLEHNEAEIMNFGLFKLICQALLNFLNLLHSFLGNYAAAILALTTIIKLCLWPLQNKANRSMRQMQTLSPKMQDLRDKYKDDPTRMNSEVMKLYKQYGVNPVGGCLPMVIQIPIFFGLFTMLRQAVELRNASFLWVHDLSQPDTVAHLFGVPINPLPIMMGLTQLGLFAMTPKTGDPTQRRIGMFMPLIFLYFCYNFAAALALYYTIQNLFTILQLYINRREPMPALEKVQPPGKPKKRR